MKSQDYQIYRRLLAYLAPYKTQFGWVLVFMAILALAEPALAALVKPLLDGSFVDKDPFYVETIPLAILGIAIVRAAGGFAVSVGMGWISEKVSVDLRNDLFGKLVMLPTSYYDKNSTGTIITRLLFQVDNMKVAATQTLVPLVRDSISIIALLAWMFYLNWELSLTIFVLGPAIALMVAQVSRRLRKLSRRLQDAVGEMMHIIEESLRNQKAVKLFLAQEHEKRRTDRAFTKVRHLAVKFAVVSSANASFIQVISAVGLSAVIYFSSLQSLSGAVSVGEFVSFFGAMALLISPIKRLTKINESLQRGLAAAENVFEVLDQPDEPHTGTLSLPTCKGMVEFRNVSFHYPGQEDLVLQDVSFKAGPNETIAIVGMSGSGKSTIASLLPLLHRPTSGQIFIDGIDVEEINLRDIRSQISYVSQEILLFDDSIAENIAYGCLNDRPPEQIAEAAERAYASEFIDKLPDKYQTQVGQAGARLSGGQRQRIAIARTLLKDSPIMIFDEATSALDTKSERKIQEAMQRLGERRTLIVIAHRLTTIENADRIVVLDQGRVVEQGSHQELLQHRGAYARMHAVIQAEEESGTSTDDS